SRRILTGVLGRRLGVARARSSRRGAAALSALSRLHVLVGGGLIAGLADRRLILGLILRSGLSGRVLLRRWLLLSRRLLCLALLLALPLALGLPATLACRLVLRHWRVRLTIRL